MAAFRHRFSRDFSWNNETYLRSQRKGQVVYNMNENYGMEIKLGKETIVIGTNYPEELIEALDLVWDRPG